MVSLKVTMIDRDLLCLKCEYNLRGLSTEGRCPECGIPIMASINRPGKHDQAPLLYRLLRVAILTTTATAWIMDFVGLSLIGERWTNWTPERRLGYDICCEAERALAVTAIASLALVVVSRRARRDPVIWICLCLSVFAWWWFVEHAASLFTMAGPIPLPA